MQQPNILLIHADQFRFDCLGVNGHPFVQTPNLDRLVCEGVNFAHAFTPIPLCTPSRTSLLTGQWPVQHGAIANKGTEGYRAIPAGTPTFSQQLKTAGYGLGYVGKWQVATAHSPTDLGFDAYIPDTGYLAWRKGQGLPPLPMRNGWFGDMDSAIQPEQSSLAWGAGQAIQLLRGFAAQAKDVHAAQPFFLRWDPKEPHLPNIVPEPYASMYPPIAIPPWPSFPDTLEKKPWIQQQQRRTWGVEGWSWDKWAPIVSRYLGEISLLDTQVGRLLDALDELGLTENTLVIFSADHGDLCGAHGMIDKHFIMYDDVVRVPLIMRWPTQLPAGAICDYFVSSAVDLAATFCAATNVTIPTTFAGCSLLAMAQGTCSSQPASRPTIYATYHGNQFGLYSQRMVRDRRWKYVWNATAEDELYDLENDPGELYNLAEDNRYTKESRNMRQHLIGWLEETGDPLLNQWTKRYLAAQNVLRAA